MKSRPFYALLVLVIEIVILEYCRLSMLIGIAHLHKNYRKAKHKIALLENILN
jgi:hypothetical protein